MVAFRYLRARRQEGFVSVIAIFSLLGIALGVATLIIVMSVMNGFRAELVGRILGLNGHLAVYGEAARLTDFDAVAGKVRQVPGVASATPLIEGQVMATAEAGAAGALVRGIRPEDIRERKLIADHIVAGSLAEFGDDGIAVGERLARRLGVGVGGRITLISPEGTDTAFGTLPRLKTYTVAALFNVGFYEYDNSFIYVPLRFGADVLPHAGGGQRSRSLSSTTPTASQADRPRDRRRARRPSPHRRLAAGQFDAWSTRSRSSAT